MAVSLVCGVFFFGILLVGFSYLSLSFCMDEPGCRDDGVSTIRASSWALAGVGAGATLGSVVLAIRLRRAWQLALVTLLALAAAGIGVGLWTRVE